MITETEKVIITSTAKSNLKQGTKCEQKAYFCHQIQAVAARKSTGDVSDGYPGTGNKYFILRSTNSSCCLNEFMVDAIQENHNIACCINEARVDGNMATENFFFGCLDL
jgi:hypothetical protein